MTDAADAEKMLKGETPSYQNMNEAPVVFFDIAPAYGAIGGIVQVELATRILIPHSDNTIDIKFVSCARLRCSATAAAFLRDALDASLKMIELPQDNPVAASKLN